jgi:hypothetical protein
MEGIIERVLDENGNEIARAFYFEGESATIGRDNECEEWPYEIVKREFNNPYRLRVIRGQLKGEGLYFQGKKSK